MVAVVEVVVDVEEGNMHTILSCQLCHERTNIDTGKMCRTCGMVLEDKGKEFCSRYCRNIYLKLRRTN